jgi:hypothetical protein
VKVMQETGNGSRGQRAIESKTQLRGGVLLEVSNECHVRPWKMSG